MIKYGYLYVIEDNEIFKRVLRPITNMFIPVQHRRITLSSIYNEYINIDKSIDDIRKELESYDCDSFIIDTQLLYTENEDILQPILRKHYKLGHFGNISKNEIIETINKYKDIITKIISKLEFDDVFDIINKEEYPIILETNEINLEVTYCDIIYDIDNNRFILEQYESCGDIFIYFKNGYKFKFNKSKDDKLIIKSIKEKESL